MSLIVGAYSSAEAAETAASRLSEAGFWQYRALLAGQLEGQEDAAVESAVDAGLMPAHTAEHHTQALRDGKSLVAVKPGFGEAREAIDILLKSGGTIESHKEGRPRKPSRATPLSDALELPVLTDQKSKTKLAPGDAFSIKSVFGLGLLSHNPAPLSSKFSWKVLRSPKRQWDRSMGMALLSDNPAPLSSRLGWNVLSSAKQIREKSFGMPLLSNDPTPLSTFFGLKVLSKHR